MATTKQDSLLRFVDVGAYGGLQKKWKRHADSIWAVLFEPNHDEAQKLRDSMKGLPLVSVIEKALGDTLETKELNITSNPTCISLREPNTEFLSRYGMPSHFEVVGRCNVECTRYDLLFAEGEVPKPDVIKIDSQGYEYEILQGFGELLQGCLGIELEVHFYKLYREQKLLHNLIELLDSFDMVLRRLNPVPHFGGDLVEADAIFTKRRHSVMKLSAIQRSKFDLLTDIWELQKYQLPKYRL